MAIEGEGGPSSTGFDFDVIDVDAYERYRPDYSPLAVTWLVEAARLSADAPVLDLAAGTGKLTRLLVAAGLQVVAVEPSRAMRTKLAELLPGVRVLDGTAEAIALPASAVGAITVGQAFHHFHPDRALAEIHRVLWPGGTLALFWNVYRQGDSIRSALDAMIDRYVDPDSAVCAAFGAWPKAFEATDLFSSAGQRSFPHRHTLPSEHLATVMATSSDVASLPAARRDAPLEEIRSLAETLPVEVEMPAETRVDLYLRT
ncbi:MAG TPA: class I SAM-dependent methyltransferase [Actinomycetota bacterium]|nr:class I SAM-dependent methyltransferase [Actinomycetota bacterium]